MCNNIKMLQQTKKIQHPIIDEGTESFHDTNNSNQEQNYEQDQFSKHGQKKRRKKVKKFIKHPPQYYENLKRMRINEKREERWDNRFINDTLYDKSEPKRVLKRAGSNRKLKPRVGNEKKVYKTFAAVDSSEGKGKGQMRSFNIRTYCKKEQGLPKIKKEQEIGRQEIQQLEGVLQNVYQQLKYSECHHILLKQIINNSKAKRLKSSIHAEIARLKNSTSTCNLVQQAIKRRSTIIQQLKQSSNITKQMIKEYQLSTIKVIEEIIRWKQIWQQIYLNVTKIKTKLTFFKDDKLNYFLKMGKDVAFLNKENFDDPFLLNQNDDNADAFDDETIIKIRACELLLLQQSLT